MKVYQKVFLIMVIITSMTVTSSCTKSVVSSAPVYEKTIELSMPEEEGIYMEKIGKGSIVLVKLNTDYGFKKYLEKGSSSMEEHVNYLKSAGLEFYDKAFELRSPFCTAYSAQMDNGDFVFGRSDDLFPEDTAILLYTEPSDGYASVSLTDGVYFGYENENTNIEDIKKYMASVAHFPADGMNECGVAIAQNSVIAQSDIDPKKVSIGSLQAVRLVLDYAKDVDEAVQLLEQYNIYFELSEQCHYMISDAAGKSAVVEFVDGKMNVIYNQYPWQVNTNFVLSKYKDQEVPTLTETCMRYNQAFKILKEKKGILKGNEPMELLKNVVQSHTLYSTVYNKTSGDIQVAMRRQFSTIYQFKMKMK